MSKEISKARKLKVYQEVLASAEEQKFAIITNAQIADEIGNQKAVVQHQKIAVDAEKSIIILERKIKEMEKELEK